MRINLYLLIFLFFASCANAQKAVRQKTDFHVPRVVRLFNNSEYDSLYRLGGTHFQKIWPTLERFRQIMHDLHTGFGDISAYTYEKIIDSTAYYTSTFKMEVMSLGLTVDAAGNLTGLSISSMVEPPPLIQALDEPNHNPLNTAIDHKTDSLARTFMARVNTVGLAIGVLDNGKFHSYGYGETKKGNGQTPDGNTLFEIGSITKTFTGILLAWFAEKKKLQLNDPINKYLPDSIPVITYNDKPVTLASLSNHSSGLPRLPSNFWQGADAQNPYIHYDDRKLFSFLKNYQMAREPGTQYEYSNLAVGLLAVILERVSGKPYEQLLKEVIWQPLKMNNTRITLTKADSALFATGHNNAAIPVHSWEFISLAGAGAIRSSVEDLLLYARAQFGTGSSDLQKAIALAQQPTWEKNQTRVALGWHLIDHEGRSYMYHNGQTGGYYSILMISPGSKKAVVMLTNALVDPMMTAVELMTWLHKQ